MKYEGALYGKCGKRYIPLIMTSADVDAALDERDALRAEVERLNAEKENNDARAEEIISAREKCIRRLQTEVERLKVMLAANQWRDQCHHKDLSEIHFNNVQGDESPVFGRGKALLTIGDFKRAEQALAEYGKEQDHE